MDATPLYIGSVRQTQNLRVEEIMAGELAFDFDYDIHELAYVYLTGANMQIAKWGNSLAVRLPAALVQKLGLKPGDEIEVLPSTTEAGNVKLAVARKPSRQELIESLRQCRWQLPSGFKFDREEANQRGGGR